MRCHICDRMLLPEEIKTNDETGKLKFEPCRKCVDASYDWEQDAEDGMFAVIDDTFDTDADVLADLENFDPSGGC